jgi:hypothetical protein
MWTFRWRGRSVPWCSIFYASLWKVKGARKRHADYAVEGLLWSYDCCGPFERCGWGVEKSGEMAK